MAESMNDSLRGTFMVEVQYLLSHSRILQEIVSARSSAERVGDIGFHSIVSRVDLAIGVSHGSVELRDLSQLLVQAGGFDLKEGPYLLLADILRHNYRRKAKKACENNTNALSQHFS